MEPCEILPRLSTPVMFASMILCAPGEGDVAADRSADERQYREPVYLRRNNRLFKREADGRLRLDDHEADHRKHDDAENLREHVHRLARLFADEQHDGAERAYDCGRSERKSAYDVKAHRRAADVSDVENEAAYGDEYRNKIAEAREDFVGYVLRALPGDAEDAPDVKLDDDVDDDGNNDCEGEGRLQLVCENGRLCQKSRPDGGGRHKEGRSDKYAGSRFFLLAHFSYLLWMMELNPHLYICKKVAEEIRRTRKSKNAKKRLSGCFCSKRRKRRAVYAACGIARAARSAKPHGRKTRREVKAGRFICNR